MIPFSPPRIDELTIKEVTDTLLSGWITTGPKTKRFEKELSAYTGARTTICLNSATAGLELVLHWYGIGPGDEVIVPAYTYCATANVVVHCGAKPVMVDVRGSDFNIDVEAVRRAITEKTKVIIPVDIGGMPCDYEALMNLVNEPEITDRFHSSNDLQKALGRIMVLSDSAHSFGATYHGKKTGVLCDGTGFSFHAVKNLTTAEGGAVSLNLPENIDCEEAYRTLNTLSLHGQSKDALSKSKLGGWRYDVLEPGYKCNMTDIQASIGLVELSRYDSEMLPRRKQIFEAYTRALSGKSWAQLPVYKEADRESSYHLYQLRIKGITEEIRDRIIDDIYRREVAVNVHFIPLPMLTAYKKRGYNIQDYPVTYDNYSREISLPVYYDLSDENVETVLSAVISAVEANL